jgi:flagellar assembly factor FliW
MKIESRFGALEVDLEKAIYFPKGIYGFKEDLHFALVDFPLKALDNFKLLQCVNDHNVCLPVIPVGYENKLISKEDMDECLETIEVDRENFLMLFISTSKKLADGSFEVSINSKAPIVMDVNLKVGIQYIFTSNKYSTNQIIS